MKENLNPENTNQRFLTQRFNTVSKRLIFSGFFFPISFHRSNQSVGHEIILSSNNGQHLIEKEMER